MSDRDPVAVIRSDELLALYTYWRSKLAGRRVPVRRDIDPTEMPAAVLPHLMLLDLEPGAEGITIRFRLTGTYIDDALGGNPTGLTVSTELFSNADYVRYLNHLYGDVAATGLPIYSENLFRLAGQAVPMVTKRLSLPLSSTGRSVDMSLAGSVFEYPGPIDIRYAETLNGFSETVRVVLQD